jgi:hypothetical protein
MTKTEDEQVKSKEDELFAEFMNRMKSVFESHRESKGDSWK